MDIGVAFTFMKDDKKWLEKIGIGIGLVIFSFLILPVMILSGYAIRLLQNVRDGEASPLPEWDDWGGDLARGFKLWIVQFVWAIPLMLFVVPVSIGGAIADTGDAGEFVGGSLLICASCLMVLYGLFLALVAPGYTISFAKDEHIGSGLELTTIWHWTQSNLGQVIIVSLVILAAGFIITALAGLVGIILCGVGILLTMPLATVIVIFFQHHLYGQLANEHPMYDSPKAAAASPTPAAPVAPAAVVPGQEIVADEPGGAADESSSEGDVIVAEEEVDTGSDELSAAEDVAAAGVGDVESAPAALESEPVADEGEEPPSAYDPDGDVGDGTEDADEAADKPA